MKPGVLILSLLLVASAVFAQNQNDPVFERLAKTERFAFGGIGRAGTISQGEVDYKEILVRPSAQKDFLKLLKEGNPQAQCYALVGLSALDPKIFAKVSASYLKSQAPVATMSGCIAGKEAQSEIVKNIEAGAWTPGKNAVTAPVLEKADSLIIPQFEVNEMPVEEALAKLQELTKKIDPEKTGISFVIDPSVNKKGLELVSLHLRSVPVRDIALYIATLSGLELKTGGNSIVLVNSKDSTTP